MKIENNYTDPVEITTASQFYDWCEEQLKMMHEECEECLTSREEDFEAEVDARYEEFKTVGASMDYYDAWDEVMDFHKQDGDFYTPDEIKTIRKMGYTSWAERNLREILMYKREWFEERSLSYLIAGWNTLCNGCGASEHPECEDFCVKMHLIEDSPEFDEEEFEKGLYIG